MFLKVNGESVEVKTGATINDLLTQLEIPKIRVAVELNGNVIPNSELLTTALTDQDILEIVKAIGGG
tara:strand:+ start:656 stop:856 length:201 start_codon:yes stop_codon:yes gene_type:complete